MISVFLTCPRLGLWRHFFFLVAFFPALLSIQAVEPTDPKMVNAGLNGNEADGNEAYVPKAGDTIAVGSDWLPYEHQLDIEAGSAFDFSFLADAPAGKYGRAMSNSRGRIVFSDRSAQEMRFWGCNIVSSACYLTKEQADEVAERLVRSGYNAVRLHHYDRSLMLAGGHAGDLDPARLDQLDYFFAALKQRGIYISIDLYCNNRFSQDEVPDLGREVKGEIKSLIPISEAAFKAWSKFAEALMTHRNPYTGSTWGEDPALLNVCPVNEDTPFGFPKKDPTLRKLYDEAFERWLSDHDRAETSATDRDALWTRFLVELFVKTDRRKREFLRSIGVKAMLSGVSCQDFQAQAYLRQEYDVVEDHNYWNHPAFLGKKWSLPIRTNQYSAITASVWHPRELMPSRVFGKPFIVTESGFVWPSACRSEGGILVPAYAALQDWDAVFTFDYAARDSAILAPSVPKSGGEIFSLAFDPIGLLADRAAALIFRRGDVKAATSALCYLPTQEEAFSGPSTSLPKFPTSFSWLGLITRIGNLTAESPSIADVARRTGISAFVGAKPVASAPSNIPFFSKGNELRAQLSKAGILPQAPSPDVYRSETGQIELSIKGDAKVITESSECFVLPPDRQAKGNHVFVKNGKSFASVYVISVDGRSLNQSGRLLVLHLTDSLPTGTQFSDANHNIVEKLGVLPYLLRQGSATLSLQVAEPPTGKWQVWALAPNGHRKTIVPSVYANQQLTFSADTATSSLAYEIRQDSF